MWRLHDYVIPDSEMGPDPVLPGELEPVGCGGGVFLEPWTLKGDQ